MGTCKEVPGVSYFHVPCVEKFNVRVVGSKGKGNQTALAGAVL